MGLLDDKIAVITGAAAGIGGGIARRFAAEGALVVANDIDADLLATAVHEIAMRAVGSSRSRATSAAPRRSPSCTTPRPQSTTAGSTCS